MRLRTILAAIDASPRAPFVLKSAALLARKYGAKLVVVRAVGIPSEVPPEALVAQPSKVPEILERLARKDLEARCREIPSDITATNFVHAGVPWDVICRAAKQENVDLIVLGSHGFSGIDRIIGTTAARVVNHADRSVLVVRETEE